MLFIAPLGIDKQLGYVLIDCIRFMACKGGTLTVPHAQKSSKRGNCVRVCACVWTLSMSSISHYFWQVRATGYFQNEGSR